MNNETIEKILSAAVRAPSGDNTQPWNFLVSKDLTRIDLHNLPEKDDSYYNFNQMASYISHGAVIENIMIAARHLGCNAKVNLFPDIEDKNHVARINLSPAEPQADSMYQAIFDRCTNRFQYKKEEITEEMIKKLSDSINNIDNVNIKLIYQRDEINALAKVLMDNDRLVFERQDIHRFLFDKIRWNKKQIDETSDGMPIQTLGLNPVEKILFPLMRFWQLVKIGNYFGLSRIIALKSWWNCRNSSILGMISVQNNDKFAFVQGGRAMQRLWLQATLQGLAIQPIIGLTLLIHRLKQNELQDFSTEHIRLVRHAAQILPQKFGINESETLIMGFRAGKGESIEIKTKRRKISINT